MLKSHYQDVAENQDKHWWYLGMANINAELLNKHLSRKKNIKILDAGCGPGAMLKNLSRYGDVVGVDVSEEALKYARKRGNVVKGDITKLSFRDKTFDLVVCMDVLYHMWVRDELMALQEFNRVLKPNGLLLLREPAFNWLRGNEDVGSLTKRRFQKKELTEQLTKASFNVLKISYANFFLFPMLLVVRMITRIKGNGTSDMSIPPIFVNNLFLGLLRLEGKLMEFTSLPFGSSLICLAVKTERAL